MEIWSKIPGVSNQHEVSTFGRVRSIQWDGSHTYPFIGVGSGYCVVTLDKKSYPVHRLVALAFLSNPDPERYKIVNHIDGNKQNNHVSNLEWVSTARNIEHAIATGLKTSYKWIKCVETGHIFASIHHASIFARVNRNVLQHAIDNNISCLGKHYVEIEHDDETRWNLNYFRQSDLLNAAKTECDINNLYNLIQVGHQYLNEEER